LTFIVSVWGVAVGLTSAPRTTSQWFPYWTRKKGEWTLLYEVGFKKGSSKAEVTIHINDPNDEVSWIYLQKQPYGPYQVSPHYITGLHAEGGKVVEDHWIVEGIKQAKLSYTVDVNVKYRGGGYSSFAYSDWIVTAGDFLFIPHGTRGSWKICKKITMKINVPDNWKIYTPYPEDTPGEFDATGITSHMRPRDFIVIGNPESIRVVQEQRVDTNFTVVAVNTETINAQELVNYLADLNSVYSKLISGTPPVVFTVVVPDPMRRHGGETRDVSLLISDDNPFPFDLSWGSSTWAHEFFHLYQKYYARESWLKEGVAYYYQFYGPFRAGYMKADEFLKVLIKTIAERGNKNAILAKNQDIYFKGSLVTLALDIKIRQDSQGNYSFDDVLRIVNTDFAQEYISTPRLNLIIKSLTGKSYNDFFKRYIESSEYPNEVLSSIGPELYTSNSGEAK